MGMFSKNPAERKLEKLTGGFILSNEFKIALRARGIDLHTGDLIKDQLKREIRQNIVSEEGLETRLNYLLTQHQKHPPKEIPSQNKPIPSQSNAEPSVIMAPSSLKRYENEVNSLKREYDTKEKIVVDLIEKSFAPPQITYDKFMDSVDKCSKVFRNEVDSALSIINLTSHETPRIDTELENKITNMKSIISQIDDLTNELIINLSSNEKNNADVENLFDDMKDLIDSVKKYD